MSQSPLTPSGALGRLATALLSTELPDLPADARDRTVGFVCRRVAHAPGPLRLGVTALTVGVGLAARVIGEERTTGLVGRTELPLLGELARLIRSLAFTYVWETWPDSSPTGAPVSAVR